MKSTSKQTQLRHKLIEQLTNLGIWSWILKNKKQKS
jgi:hypothetical protein